MAPTRPGAIHYHTKKGSIVPKETNGKIHVEHIMVGDEPMQITRSCQLVDFINCVSTMMQQASCDLIRGHHDSFLFTEKMSKVVGKLGWELYMAGPELEKVNKEEELDSLNRFMDKVDDAAENPMHEHLERHHDIVSFE